MDLGTDGRTTAEVAASDGAPSRLERCVLGALLAIAVLLRLTQVGAPLDRHFDGFQGAFFTICAINYERLAEQRPSDPGLPDGAGSGYPVVNLELDGAADETWYLYANHPPTVAWLAWAGLTAMAPDGWSDAWRDGRAPAGFEAALRAPFLALHLLGLLALFAAVRAAGCRRAAWYATTLYAWAPAAILFSGLANYENPSVPFALLGAAAALRYLREPRAVWLAATALAFACAGAITYAPIFTAGAIGAMALTAGLRRAVPVAAAAIAGTLAPLVVHGAAARALLAEHGQAPDSLTARIRTMVAPLLDGETPFGEWLGVQARLLGGEVGWTALALAALGLAVAVRRVARGAGAAAPPVDRSAALALALTVGGAAMQLAFYRHTRDPQDPFILHLVPGLAALGGVVLGSISARSRGRALALAVLLVTVAESALRTAALHERWRGTPSAPSEASESEHRSLPPIELGPPLAELIGSGDVAWYPAALGLNPATGLYAWRTLLPVAPGGYALTQLSQNELGLEPATTWLAVPAILPRSARADVDALLADLEAALPGSIGEPTAENSAWRVWRLRH